MNKSVLIVEDEKVLRDVYKLILVAKDFTVHAADNGFDGLKQLKLEQPSVVLLDLFMPVMDGKEFLRNIDVSDYPDTKFIVYSNMSSRETEEEMLNLGAHKYINKSSMSPQDLVVLVSDLTRR